MAKRFTKNETKEFLHHEITRSRDEIIQRFDAVFNSIPERETPSWDRDAESAVHHSGNKE